jgi:murein DD-endopeptidase MepM/ murein hydrolase activator NlpD
MLIGVAVAMASIGVGAASAQTPDPATEPVEPVEDAGAGAAEATTTSDATEPAPQEAEDPAAADATAAEQEDQEKSKRGTQALRLVLEDASPNKVFWSGMRKAKFKYEFAGSRTVDLTIEVMRSRGGADQLMRRYRLEDRHGGREYTLTWDGKRKSGSNVKRGKFYFRVSEQGGPRATRSNADGNRSFRMYRAIFPIDGAHDYWDGFGAGRGHQGQDLGAKCGTPLRAAEAGTVTTKAYNAGGYGYYVVIDVKGSDRSEVYGHLKDKAKVNQGQKVKTGQRIGRVGETGNASGCHLHFEYRPNGVPSAQVTNKLKAWDKYS